MNKIDEMVKRLREQGYLVEKVSKIYKSVVTDETEQPRDKCSTRKYLESIMVKDDIKSND